jgi:hypothetical protein
LKKPSIYKDYEDYTIIYIQSFNRNLKSFEILREIDLAKLLLGEKYHLSEQIENNLLRNKFSYSDEDLIVLNWDSCFIYEPDGIMDVPDLLCKFPTSALEFFPCQPTNLNEKYRVY